MPQATIEVQYVNPPKEGFSSGSIKCLFPNGKADYIEVHEDMLSDFVKGGTYTVFYVEKTRRTTGKPYKQFQELVSKPVDAKHDAAPVHIYSGTDTRTPAPTTAPGAPVQRPPREDPMQASPRTNFVSNVVGSALHSGLFKAEDILELTIAAHRAWGAAFLGKGYDVQVQVVRPRPSDAVRNSPLARAAVTPGGIPEADFLRDDPPPPDPAAYGATRD